MSKMSCGVIRDLLPLYADGALSDESRALVEEHLAECGECREALSRMREEILAPRAEEPDVAEALKGLRRALRRTKIKLIVIAIAAAILLSWVGFAVWEHVAMTWEVRVPPENVVIADLCHTTSGLILYRDSMKDGFAAGGIYAQYIEDDGAIYLDYSRLKINPWKESAYLSDQWEWIGTILRDGQFLYPTDYGPESDEPTKWGVVTSIRIGTPDDYITAWEDGTDIPLADSETDEWYEYYMNPPSGGGG